MKDIHKTKKELLEEIQELRECNRDHNTRRHYRDINPGNRSEHDFCSESFYELSPLMYFTVDRQGIVREVNRLGARHLGYSRKELAGLPVTNIFYPEDREDAENLLKNCFENPDKVHRWELRKVKKDGNVIWVKEHARVGGFDNGNGLAIIICEDITEHKQAQFLLGTDKMMFDLMARHATLFEILSSLCLEIEKQSNGMLCSFLLLDENGKSLRHGAAPSLPEGYVKSVDGVEIGARVGSCGTAAYTKKPVIVTDIETDPLWADYKHLALKYDLRACWSNPIITADNRVLGTFAMYYDHERAPSQQEKVLINAATHLARIAIEQHDAQELATRFGEILEESLNEIYIFDSETYRFLKINKGARINLGYTDDELLNMTPFDIKPEIRPGFFDRFKPLLTGEEEKMSFSSVHLRKDGSRYPVDVYLHGSSFNGKKVFVANVIDITDQKETEEELEEKVEQLSKKNRYESIIRAVTESLHKSLDLGEVFDNAVDALNKNVEGAENVVIFMVEGDEAVMKASRGHSERYVKKLKRIPYPKGATWKTIIEGKPRYVPDTDADDVLGAAGKEFGTKSYLSMPIRSEENTIGCIHIHSAEKNTFCEEDHTLLEIVARQLGSAIKNAEQAEEVRQSREDIKQKLNELSKKKRYEEIINTVTRSVHSSIELQQVLDNAVGAMASNVSAADNVSIYFVEGSEAVIQARRGYPDWFIEKVTRIPYPKGFTWKTMIEGKLQYSPDVDKDNVIGPLGKKVGTKSYASMPIKYEGNTIGCININSFSKNSFDEEELNLLELIAAQIEIAVNNARQAEALRKSKEALKKNVTKLRRKNRFEKVISSVTRSLHVSLDLNEVFENAVESINKEVKEARHVLIYIIENISNDNNELFAVVKAQRGHTREFVEKITKIPYPKGATWKTLIEGKSRYVANTDNDPSLGQAGRDYGIKSYISKPIKFEDNTVGCINIHSLKKSAFSKDHIKLIDIVARQLETAINNAKKTEALRSSEETLRKTMDELEDRVSERTYELQKSNALLKNEILERRCVEKELKQSLAGKNVLLQEIHHRVKNNLQIISSLINLQSKRLKDPQALSYFIESNNRIRSIATLHEQLYRSKDLSRIDFGVHIRDMTNHLLRSFGKDDNSIKVVIDSERIYLDINTAIPCGLIVNELVSNAIKHGFEGDKTGEIAIEFKKAADKYLLKVSNNGIRFPRDLDIYKSTTLGLELVTSLSKQLQGAITMTTEDVTEFKLEFLS